jgi:hypothetical protein
MTYVTNCTFALKKYALCVPSTCHTLVMFEDRIRSNLPVFYVPACKMAITKAMFC